MANFRQILMKRLLACSAAALCFFAAFANRNEAHYFYYQQPTDSLPSNIIPHVQVTVRDLNDGSFIDSAYVVIGKFKGYTDKSGVVAFENVIPGSLVVITKSGYYIQSSKAKALIQFHLLRKEIKSRVASVNNGLYERPVEHFSGAATTISGNDLRKINPLNFTEALKYYDKALSLAPTNAHVRQEKMLAIIALEKRINNSTNSTN